MAIEDSALYREVNAIVSTGVKPVKHRWECQIHAAGKTIEPYFVVGMEIDRNYIENYTDITSIQVSVAPGTYNYSILPNKDKLEVTLRRIPLNELGNAVNESSSVQSFRYRAVLFDNSSPLMEGNNPTMINQGAADRSSIKEFKMQLLDPVIERLRMQTVGGIYRDVKPGDLIRAILGKYSKLAGDDVAVKVKGVDLAPGDNPEVRNHYVIPHLTKVTDLPKTVHEKFGGVYGGGFGYYLQNGIWYLYPPYDVTRYKEVKKSLTLINVPANRFPSSERTYRTTPTQVIVLATGDVKNVDISEELQLNAGNGVRFVDAKRVMEGFAELDGNKATIDRTKNTNEFVAEHRPGKMNNVQQSPNRITSNYLVEMGRLAQRRGSYIQAVWESSNDSLLYPGMPVKYMYLQNETPIETYGILVGAHTFHICNSMGPVNRQFTAHTALTIFVDRKIKLNE